MITSILRVLLTRSFKPLMFTSNIDYKMEFDSNEIGIYVHIPFCKTLCPFCPYNKIKYDESIINPYKTALIDEINMVGGLYEDKKVITSVYFGGGSPALMLNELGEIITALKKNFNISSSIGIELHPSDITKESLFKIKSIGFDMVSIGIQSFQSECLNSLGREYIDGAEKVRLVKAAGFNTIDVDLIFGIANQGEDVLKKDFLMAFELGATQVSTYPFIDFSYANNIRKPLGKQEKKQLLDCLEKTSVEIGCDRTAVWTFAKKGTSRYSSITRDAFIGFGPSATSLTKEFLKLNTFSVEEYIKRVNNGKIPAAMTMKFSERNRALYWLFWNAYTLKFNNDEFKKLFGVNLEKMFKIELRIGITLRLLTKVENSYILTKKGTYFYHLLEQKYTNRYIDKSWREARGNPWPNEIRLY
ncbi:radical SAM protein [Clostridium estertheticum]|uniref:radical SAM protein n=1 Tax=Clostridium estertheticum TaxID=238834 RepID=UPI001CF363A5|nr:radical SAM protein [Clostridium estertheticum]MCB2307339.1 radical SAM protein [Clostridium estertheticum]MCB2344989.1 radical SAM protein [Clostridium estertheticum]MCB2349849.1 radical SAM protein [Clostridium estertheticum]WAG48225.1 radical SAM protein [Clostridium estertheticum]